MVVIEIEGIGVVVVKAYIFLGTTFWPYLLIGFSAGSQREPMDRALACVPPEIPRIHFTTDLVGAGAALQLMAQSMAGFVELADRLNMIESDVGKPRWTSKLFFMPIDSEA